MQESICKIGGFCRFTEVPAGHCVVSSAVLYPGAPPKTPRFLRRKRCHSLLISCKSSKSSGSARSVGAGLLNQVRQIAQASAAPWLLD